MTVEAVARLCDSSSALVLYPFLKQGLDVMIEAGAPFSDHCSGLVILINKMNKLEWHLQLTTCQLKRLT